MYDVKFFVSFHFEEDNPASGVALTYHGDGRQLTLAFQCDAEEVLRCTVNSSPTSPLFFYSTAILSTKNWSRKQRQGSTKLYFGASGAVQRSARFQIDTYAEVMVCVASIEINRQVAVYVMRITSVQIAPHMQRYCIGFCCWSICCLIFLSFSFLLQFCLL